MVRGLVRKKYASVMWKREMEVIIVVEDMSAMVALFVLYLVDEGRKEEKAVYISKRGVWSFKEASDWSIFCISKISLSVWKDCRARGGDEATRGEEASERSGSRAPRRGEV